MILDLEGSHSGETIYIIGAGPGLGNYTEEVLQALGEKICIGVNRTQYKVRLTYFMSSYLSENLLAKIVDPNVYAIHTRPALEAPLVDGIRTIRREYSEDVTRFSSKLDQDDPCLITRNNVIFLATNMALVMGAKRIVYVGCEQRNGMHFYNTDDNLLNRMIIDMCHVIVNYGNKLGADHPYEYPLRIMRAITANAESLKETPFYVMDHTKLLSEWIGRLQNEFGLEVYSSSSDSVMTDAGALFMPLEQALTALD